MECLRYLARDTSFSTYEQLLVEEQRLRLALAELLECLQDLVTSLSTKQQLLEEEHKIRLRLTLAINLAPPDHKLMRGTTILWGRWM